MCHGQQQFLPAFHQGFCTVPRHFQVPAVFSAFVQIGKNKQDRDKDDKQGDSAKQGKRITGLFERGASGFQGGQCALEPFLVEFFQQLVDLHVQCPVGVNELFQLCRDGFQLALPFGFHVVQNLHDRLHDRIATGRSLCHGLRGSGNDTHQGIGDGPSDLFDLGNAVLHA